RPADLEDVGEIRVEMDREIDRDRRPTVIDEAEMVVGDSVPQQDLAAEMDRSTRYDRAVYGREVGVREIDEEPRVVPAQGGAQEERPMVPQGDAEPGQESRSVVVEAELAEALGRELPEAVEHGEEIVVLEHAGPIVDPR